MDPRWLLEPRHSAWLQGPRPASFEQEERLARWLLPPPPVWRLAARVVRWLAARRPALWRIS